MKTKNISEPTIRRLPVYLRYLERAYARDIKQISSQEIGEKLGYKSTQVRKDLSYFGDFGKKGVGYDVEYLIRGIQKILHLDKEIGVCLVGIGKLGQALTNYNIYLKDNMKIVALFDNNEEKVGEKVGKLKIQSVKELEKTIKKKNIKVGIIAVPHDYAQEVANGMIKNGVKAILNFAPISLNVPEEIHVRDVDYIAELHSLAYFVE